MSIILYTDDKAASLKTVSGWVSRNNRFYGSNEHLARIDGCTHRICEKCNVAVIEKKYHICRDCYKAGMIELFMQRPADAWANTEVPVYSHIEEMHFYDLYEFIDFCCKKGIIKKECNTDISVSTLSEAAEKLLIELCNPVGLVKISEESIMPALIDNEIEVKIPNAVINAIETFNKIIEKYNTVLFYDLSGIRWNGEIK